MSIAMFRGLSKHRFGPFNYSAPPLPHSSSNIQMFIARGLKSRGAEAAGWAGQSCYFLDTSCIKALSTFASKTIWSFDVGSHWLGRSLKKVDDDDDDDDDSLLLSFFIPPKTNLLFLNMPSTVSFSFSYVFSNKHKYNFVQQIFVKKCPSRIRGWDSNPQPSDYESPPIAL